MAMASADGEHNVLTVRKLNTDDVDAATERLSPIVSYCALSADATDLVYVDENTVAVALANGHVQLVPLSGADGSLLPSHTFHHPSAVHSVDCNTFRRNELVCASDDGALYIYDVTAQRQLRAIHRASSASIFAARYSGVNTLVAVGLNGRVQLWDTRSNVSAPVLTSYHHGALAFTCVHAHPSRNDTVVCGALNGLIDVFDLRNDTAPMTSLVAHSGAVWAAEFLPFDPSTVVSASDDGALCIFDFNRNKRDVNAVTYKQTSDGANDLQPIALYKGAASVNAIAVDRATHTVAAATDDLRLIHCQYLIS